MLTKLLITIAVILLVWRFYSRKQQLSDSAPQEESPLLTAPQLLKRYGLAAGIAAVLMAGLGLGAWHWYDGYQVVQVTISTPGTDEKESYQVRKKDIESDQILTIDGLHIRISKQEKMQVAPTSEQPIERSDE